MGHVTRFSKPEYGTGRKKHFEDVPENRTAVDNILRVNHGNQMRLGLMADAKANIMITVASIVFSITIANLDNEVMRYTLLTCLLYTSPSPRDVEESRMPSSA